jgi:radical SAM protein with 4Fe4S-binding SPASM domain
MLFSFGARLFENLTPKVDESRTIRVVPSEYTLLKPPAPFSMNIELTSLCNQKCVMCPLTARNTLSSRNIGHMAPATWQRVLVAARLVGQVQWIGYGETLLHPNATEWMGEADDCGIRSSLSTNGTMLSEKVCAALGQMKNLVHLGVSIDSLDPEVFRTIRKTPLDKVLAGARTIVRYVDVRRITIGVVVMKDNIDTLWRFPPFLASLGIKKLQLNVLHEYKGKHFNGAFADSHDSFQQAMKSLRQAAADHGLEVVVDVPDRLKVNLHDPGLYNQKYHRQPAPTQTRRCLLPWEFPFVDKDGRLFLCSNATGPEAEMMGSLLEDDFMTIWHNDRFQSVRRKFLASEALPKSCANCTIQALGTHPLNEYRAEIKSAKENLADAPKREIKIEIKNTGLLAWDARAVSIGTVRPRDRASSLHHQDWLSVNRAGANSASVAPGETIMLKLRVADSRAPFSESIQLVMDGKHWVANTEVVDTGGTQGRP